MTISVEEPLHYNYYYSKTYSKSDNGVRILSYLKIMFCNNCGICPKLK